MRRLPVGRRHAELRSPGDRRRLQSDPEERQYGFEADQLDDFKGLNRRSPWWAFIMLLVMFSLAGVPPTVGFYAKFSVLQAAVEAGFTWLAVVAVLASLVGAFYYLRIVKLMYFDEPIDTAPIAARGDNQVLLSTNGLALLLFGISQYADEHHSRVEIPGDVDIIHGH